MMHYSNLTKMIEERYSKYGVKIEMEDTPEELRIEKIKNRKPLEGKKETHAQKIIEWREKVKPGTEYKIQTLLERNWFK